MIEFEIIGECVAKGRPRFKNVGRFVQTYTPEKTENYENLVKLAYYNANQEAYTCKETKLSAYIVVYKQVPKSASKKQRALMLSDIVRPTSRPDLDNCAKSILDALNGIAFVDDSQIVELRIAKYYAEEPKTKVIIEEI